MVIYVSLSNIQSEQVGYVRSYIIDVTERVFTFFSICIIILLISDIVVAPAVHSILNHHVVAHF